MDGMESCHDDFRILKFQCLLDLKDPRLFEFQGSVTDITPIKLIQFIGPTSTNEKTREEKEEM